MALTPEINLEDYPTLKEIEVRQVFNCGLAEAKFAVEDVPRAIEYLRSRGTLNGFTQKVP